MASFYFFKVPHTIDVLLLSSLVLHFSGLLNLLLERLMTLIDQARNFDFANPLHHMKNVTGTWWHDIISKADLRHSKLNTTIIILKNTLRSVCRRICFFFLRTSAKFEQMSSAYWRALTFLFTIVHASVLRKFRAKKNDAGLVQACWCAPMFLLLFPVLRNNQ